MTTISNGVDTLAPLLIDGYRSSRESRNIVHAVIGSAAPSVTLKPSSLRTGTLRMLCADLATALAIQSLHAGSALLTLADTDLPALGMHYIATGRIGLELDEPTRRRWWVLVEFQEVSL